MKKYLSIVLALSFTFFGCLDKKKKQTSASETKSQTSSKDFIVIGYTESKTGKFATESREQSQGLKLWAEDVNKNGGIYVKVLGKRLKVKLISYDDESLKDRVQQLYTRLITEDKADFLISPYSSGLTASAAVVSEQYGKILIATGAASDKIFKKGYELVYQIYTPASRYLKDAIDLLKEKHPDVKKIAIIYENSNFAKSVATAAKKYAEENGFKVVVFESYDPGTSDFTTLINKIKEKGAQALIGGGHFTDGQAIAKQVNDVKLPLKMLCILVAPAIDKFKEIGKAALYVSGPSQWEPKVNYSPETYPGKFYGISSKEFVEKYKKIYAKDPSYHAAGGYTAGLVLQKAIEDSGSLETSKVKKALDNMDVYTLFGHIKFEKAPYHGRQEGHKMVIVQWQEKQNKLDKEIVYPKETSTSNYIPYNKKF